MGRTLLRFIAIVAATLVTTLVLVAAGLIGLVQLEPARQELARVLGDLASTPGETGLRIEGIGAGLPLQLSVERIVLSDGAGPWLEVRGLRFAWRPRALLARRLHVEEVVAAVVEVARPPQAAPEPAPPEADEEPEPFRFPRLPLALRIDRLAVDALRLAPPVAGEPLALGIEGRLAAEDGQTIASDLRVTPLDGEGGGITARLSAVLDPASRHLEIDGVVREPAGGALGGLLGLADRPPISVTLAGRGPLADWRGTVTAEAGGLGGVQADVSLHDGEIPELGITGRALVAERLLPPLAPALAHGVQFEVQLRQPGRDLLRVDRVSLNATGMTASASGDVDLAASTLDVAAEVAVQEKALAAGALGPVRLSAAQATARASGALSAPDLKADGRIDGLGVPGMLADGLDWTAIVAPREADGTGVGDAAGDAAGGWALQADVRAAGVAFEAPAGAALIGDRPTLSVRAHTDPAGERLTLQVLQLDGAAAALAATGTLATGDGRFAADLRLTLPDLTRAGPPGLGGRAVLSSRIEGETATPVARGSVRLETARLASGVAAADALLGPQPTLDATFDWSAAAGLDIPQLRLAARAIEGDGRARLSADGGALDSALALSVPSLQPLSAPLGTPLRGRARLQAAATGNPADPDVTAALQLEGASAAGTGIARARVDLRAGRVASGARGRLEADAQTDLGPMSAATDFALEGGNRLQLGALSVSALGLGVDGALQAALDRGLVTGRLRAGPRDPAAGLRVDSLALIGPFGLDVALEPEANRQQVRATLRGGPLALRDGSAQVVEIGTLQGEANVADALAAPRFDARLAITDARAGEARLASAEATARGVLQGAEGRGQVTLAVSAPDEEEVQLTAAGEVALSAGAVAFELQRLDGRLAGEPVALTSRARLLSAGERMQLEGLALTLGSARLTADGRLQSGETTANLGIEDLPAGLARRFSAQAPVSGRIDARLALRTQDRETVGEADLRLQGLGWEERRPSDGRRRRGGDETPRLDARLAARLGGGRLTIDGTAEGEGASATLVGGLPVRLPAGTLEPVDDRDGRIDGRLTLAGDLRQVARVLAFHDQRLEGALSGDLRLGGTLAMPEVEGGIRVREGLYENFVTGTLLRQIAVDVEAENRHALRLRLTGTDGNGGHIGVDGRADLGGEDGLAVDAEVTADRAMLVRRDDATATTGAHLAYVQRGTEGRLSGDVETVEVVIRLLDRLPPQVVVLPVREIGGPDSGGDGEAAGGEPWSATLDLAIRLPRRVFVRGRGLESEWAGDLTVSGTTAEPRIGGEITLVRGEFSFSGKRFTLERGVVRFDGDVRPDPLIDAVAEYRTRALTARIAVFGLASEPKLTITSQPPLPESEILAQVLFGKSSAKLGPVEAVQLAAAVEALARGESMSENVLDFTRTLLGLDTLTVQPASDADDESSIAVGRYVGDRVYIGAKQGLGDAGGQAGTVEVEIAPGISIESEIGQDRNAGTQGSLGLKWKWDY